MSTELPSQPMEYFREKYTNADERNLYIWATKKKSDLVKNELQWDLGIIAGKRAHLVPESGDDFGYCRMFHSRRRAFYPNIFPVVELDCCWRSLYAFSFILPPLLSTAQIFPQYLTTSLSPSRWSNVMTRGSPGPPPMRGFLSRRWKVIFYRTLLGKWSRDIISFTSRVVPFS